MENLETKLDAPLEAFQERTAADVAEKVRFLYGQWEYRLGLRRTTAESLLQQECEIDTRMEEVERAHGWFNEVGEKERMELRQELRNLRKERQKAYENAFSELLKIKSELVDALIEYRSLRRRGTLLEDMAGKAWTYDLPLLPQYVVGEQPATPAFAPRLP
jgi:chemotaxis protein histidine kinase CheA